MISQETPSNIRFLGLYPESIPEIAPCILCKSSVNIDILYDAMDGTLSIMCLTHHQKTKAHSELFDAIEDWNSLNKCDHDLIEMHHVEP